MNFVRHLGEGISGYLDGELDGSERRQAEAHIAGCEVCRQDLEDIAMVRATLRSLPMLELPTDLTTARAKTRPIYRRPRFFVGAAAAAAVAALVAFATIFPEDAVFALSDDTFAASYRARASLDPTFTGRPISPAIFVDNQIDPDG
jgi:anti-sigma factor RsiW